MIQAKIRGEVELIEVACCSCGISIFLSKSHQEKLRESHKTFYCPNGHSQYYPEKNKAEKLRDELEQERRINCRLSAQLVELQRNKERTQKERCR